MAAGLAASGATVVLSSRRADALAAAAEPIGADWVVANAGDPEAAESAVATTIDRHGALDVLVLWRDGDRRARATAGSPTRLSRVPKTKSVGVVMLWRASAAMGNGATRVGM